MAKKRKPTDMLAALRWQEYNAAPTIAEKYPQVAALTVEMTLHDDSGVRVIETRSQSYDVAQTKTLIRIDCPNYECVRGGFDLSQVVASAIQNNERENQGKLVCQGWQDQERVGKFHCFTDLVYKLSISYR